MTPDTFALRPYRTADQEAVMALWCRTWQHAYPKIDFAARLAWWRERWCSELVPACAILVAEVMPVGTDGAVADRAAAIAGFVTVDPATGYLDQIVVDPEAWGSPVAAALLGAAKRIAPCSLSLHVNQDNARAIRFYEKHGFAVTAKDVNPRSGAPVYKMTWRET